MPKVTIETYHGLESFINLEEAWRSLSISERHCVYTQHEWFLAWLDTFGKDVQIITIAAKNGVDFVGLLPICLRRTNKHGLFFKITEPISGGQPDYHCPVIKEGWEDIVLPLMLDKLWSVIGSDAGTFFWPNIPKTNSVTEIIRESLKKHSLQYVESYGVCPRISFAKNYMETESQWRKNHRTDVRRQRRRLSEMGQLSIWTPGTLEEAEKFLPEFFEVYGQKWLSQNLPSKLNKPEIQKYFRNMVHRLWGKGLHISSLKVDEVSVSYHFGFLSGGWLLWYMPTYRIDYEKKSPTKVHISYLIENGIAAGWRGIDFLQGNEGYKLDWANESEQTVSFIVKLQSFSPSFYWFAYGKDFIRYKIGNSYMRLAANKQKFLNFVSFKGKRS